MMGSACETACLARELVERAVEHDHQHVDRGKERAITVYSGCTMDLFRWPPGAEFVTSGIPRTSWIARRVAK